MNLAILIGRLTADPECRTTPSGVEAASYCLAVQRDFKNAQGERDADFINVIAWRAGATLAREHFKKGMKIAVTGRIQTRSYDAQDGSKRYVTEIVADRQEFCEKKTAEAAPGGTRRPDEMQEVEDDELPF